MTEKTIQTQIMIAGKKVDCTAFYTKGDRIKVHKVVTESGMNLIGSNWERQIVKEIKNG